MKKDLIKLDEEKEIEFKTYMCQNCSSIFTVPISVKNASCVFCSSKKADGINNIDYSDYSILPFVDSLGDAKRKYRKKIKYNYLLPMVFRSRKTISNMKRIYLPCMLYDVKVTGKISFYGADKVRGVKNSPMQTFDSSYDINIQYDNVLLCAFDKVKDEMLCEINDFILSSLKDYDPNEMSNLYLVPVNEYVDQNTEGITERVRNNVLNIVRDNVNHELRKLNKDESKIEVTSVKKVFVPVYLLNIIYKDNNYIFLMNGQTGTSTIDLTTSKLSLALFSLIVFIIVFIIIVGIAFVL